MHHIKPSSEPRPLTKIKMGQAFTFEPNGPVYVKCRGGFRYGLGGPLHACRPFQTVYPYTIEVKND